MAHVIVSIVSYNSVGCIRRCLESVLNQTYQDFEVRVLDNNSTDGTQDILLHLHDDRLTTEFSAENLGFCGGHNQIISKTQGEYVLLVNPDVVLPPGYIEKAVAAITADERIGTVCGLLCQSDPADPNARIDSAGLKMTLSRRMILMGHGVLFKDYPLVRKQVFGADGALPFYKRAMILDVSIDGKFFDERFFAHKEDWDVSWRSSLLGWKTVFEPECIAIHPRVFRPGDVAIRASMAPMIRFHAVKNQLLLILKNETLIGVLMSWPFVLARQVAIVVHLAIWDRPTLRAYSYVLENLGSILESRRKIQDRKRDWDKVRRIEN